MSLLIFLTTFLVYLVLAGLIVIGFYIITRGETSVQPDGTVRRKGKIFKGWSLFWERTTGMRQVYYCDSELVERLTWLKQYNMGLAQRFKIAEGHKSLEFLTPLTSDDQNYIRDVLQCKIVVNNSQQLAGTDACQYLFLYVEEPVYYYPEWLRFPLSQCPPCMASVGGSLLYWPVVIASGNFFSWCRDGYSPALLAVFFWILFCLALSAVNKLAYNMIGT